MSKPHPARQPIVTLESMFLMSASAVEIESVGGDAMDPAIGPLPGLDFPGDLIIEPGLTGGPQVRFLADEPSPLLIQPILETEIQIDGSNLNALDGVRVFAQQVAENGEHLSDAELVILSDGRLGVAGTSESGAASQVGLNPHTMVAEQIVITFAGELTGGEFEFTNLFQHEGDRRGGIGHEQGRWEALRAGQVVATGQFVADSSHTGTVQIELPDGIRADTLTFTPTEYSGGQNGSTLDSSDFFLKSVRVKLVTSPASAAPLAESATPVTFIENTAAVQLGVSVADTSVGSWSGATLTLARSGGPVADDIFSLTDADLSTNADLTAGDVTIGRVLSHANGQLQLAFSEHADSARVNSVLSQLAYRNTADYLSGHAQLQWTLNTAAGTTTTMESTVRLIDADRIYVTTTAREVDGDTSSIAALNANSGGTGISLEEAIIAANNTTNTSGADEIFFNIAGDGVHVIAGIGQPDITDAVTIDASTESDFIDRPLIVMDGNDAQGNGFTITSTADGTEIRGFNIRDFAGHGIEIQAGSEDNTIASNWIGRMAADGSDAGVEEQNGGAGIFIAGGHNYIGGMPDSEANVISGNGKQGIRISGEHADVNVIHGNLIGTDLDGGSDIGNRWAGIRVDGGADDTVIGGTQSGAGNILSGNGTFGVRITGAGTMDATIQGNLIGTDHTGRVAAGNDINGVLVDRGASGTTIGGSQARAGNVISANTQQGIRVSGVGTDLTVIQGNVIGTNADGTAGLGNGAAGILIDGGAKDTVVGGDEAGTSNIISGNGAHGVRVTGSGTADSTIAGNLIGTDQSGTTAIGNSSNGVRIDGGAQGTTVGGDSQLAGNVISANGTQGVRITGQNTNHNVVAGNVIGTDSHGVSALGNRFAGVLIDAGARHSVIGGAAFGAENIISGNGTHGIRISGSGTNDHTVQGNLIGTDHRATVAIGNAASGVLIDRQAQGNTIGGEDMDAGNVIGGNRGDGVRIVDQGTDNNAVLNNFFAGSSSPVPHLPNGRSDIYAGGETRGNIIQAGREQESGPDSQCESVSDTVELLPNEPSAVDLAARVVETVSHQLPDGVVVTHARPTNALEAADGVVITLQLRHNPDAGQVTMLLNNAHAVASGELLPDFSSLPFPDVSDVPAASSDVAPRPAGAPRKEDTAADGTAADSTEGDRTVGDSTMGD